MQKQHDFRFAVTSLWNELGMGTPNFSDTASIVLSIDDTIIRLQECVDGRHLDIVGDAGYLAEKQDQLGRQVRRILEVNTSRWFSSSTCVCLDRSVKKGMMLICFKRYAYSTKSTAALKQEVEEVLFATEYWRSELSSNRAAVSRQVHTGDQARDMSGAIRC